MKFRLSAALMMLVLVMIMVSSCTREYVCKCTISYSGQPGLPDTLVREYPVKDTKKKAKAVCEENSQDSEQGGIKSAENCHLY